VILQRVALHARRLEITHPQTGAPLAFEAPLPADIDRTLALLRSR
jgi:23S rRNA-/tRNA-specific pseudouridylate synthase